jgi:hypothetical protein
MDSVHVRNKFGDYETEEEGSKAIDKYIEDPGNFAKPKRITLVTYLNAVIDGHLDYKDTLGTYNTKEEAQEALEKYRKDRRKFPNVEKYWFYI